MSRSWRSRLLRGQGSPVFAGLVLVCEPARHRWEPLAATAGEAGL